jgi:hypothetical protein
MPILIKGTVDISRPIFGHLLLVLRTVCRYVRSYQICTYRQWSKCIDNWNVFENVSLLRIHYGSPITKVGQVFHVETVLWNSAWTYIDNITIFEPIYIHKGSYITFRGAPLKLCYVNSRFYRTRMNEFKDFFRPKIMVNNGANPTIVSYNAVKIYNSSSSIARFWNKTYFILL